MKCDLVVAGAGIAGMCAAIAAARKGLSVAIGGWPMDIHAPLGIYDTHFLHQILFR